MLLSLSRTDAARPNAPLHSPNSEILEGASELRLMLCKEKRVPPGSSARAGTSVIAACGEFFLSFPRALLSDPHPLCPLGAPRTPRPAPAHTAARPPPPPPPPLSQPLPSPPTPPAPPPQNLTFPPLSSSTFVPFLSGIFVQDILEAVPIDKYFELFKPGAGGEGGFIRVAMAFYTDKKALEKGAAAGHGRGGGGGRRGGAGGGRTVILLAALAAAVGVAAKVLAKK